MELDLKKVTSIGFLNLLNGYIPKQIIPAQGLDWPFAKRLSNNIKDLLLPNPYRTKAPLLSLQYQAAKACLPNKVYPLVWWLNRDHEVIPMHIIKCPRTAEPPAVQVIVPPLDNTRFPFLPLIILEGIWVRLMYNPVRFPGSCR